MKPDAHVGEVPQSLKPRSTESRPSISKLGTQNRIAVAKRGKQEKIAAGTWVRTRRHAMAPGVLALRRLARRDPEEEAANQAEGGLGGRAGGRSREGMTPGAARSRRKDGLGSGAGGGSPAGGAAAVQVARGRGREEEVKERKRTRVRGFFSSFLRFLFSGDGGSRIY